MYSRLIYSRGTSRFFFDSGNTSDVGLTHDPSERGSGKGKFTTETCKFVFYFAQSYQARQKDGGKETEHRKKEGRDGRQAPFDSHFVVVWVNAPLKAKSTSNIFSLEEEPCLHMAVRLVPL